jgi:hypothetical protein
MNRRMSVAVTMFAAIGCSSGTLDPASQTAPPETVAQRPSPATFAGEWRSVTPSLEFIGLSVSSKSSEAGALAARLTFSGVYWDGGGRIQGDSLVASMTVVGATAPTSVLVARASDAKTLHVLLRPAAGSVSELTFVREN